MRLSFGFLAALLTLSATFVAGTPVGAAPKKVRVAVKLSQKQLVARKKTVRRKPGGKVARAPKRYLRWFSGL